jgi:hypothetical protein
MTEKLSSALYKKVGRKYVPVSTYWQDSVCTMETGTFRLTYAYSDGGRRYEYDVTPATAASAAAMLIAKAAISDAIREAAKMRPSGNLHYTKKQLATIEKFRIDMGGMMPTWWTENDGYRIANAAINAVLEFKP